MVGFQVCLEPMGGTAAKLAGMSISKWSRNARAGYIINYTKELSRNSRTSRKKKNSSSLRSAVSKHTQRGSSCCCKPSSSPCSPPALGFSSFQRWAGGERLTSWVTEPPTASAAQDVSELGSRTASGDPVSLREGAGWWVRKTRSREKDMAKYVKRLHTNAPVSSVFREIHKPLQNECITPDELKSLACLRML